MCVRPSLLPSLWLRLPGLRVSLSLLGQPKRKGTGRSRRRLRNITKKPRGLGTGASGIEPAVGAAGRLEGASSYPKPEDPLEGSRKEEGREPKLPEWLQTDSRLIRDLLGNMIGMLSFTLVPGSSPTTRRADWGGLCKFLGASPGQFLLHPQCAQCQHEEEHDNRDNRHLSECVHGLNHSRIHGPSWGRA